MLRRFNTFRDRSLALRAIAATLRAGMTLAEALDVLQRGRVPAAMARACATAAELLRRGEPVHLALTQGNSTLVEPTEGPLIQAAEQSGALAEAISALADHAEQSGHELTAIVTRLAYPVLVFHMLAFVVGLMAFAGGSSALGAALGILVPGYACVALLAWLYASPRGQHLAAQWLLPVPIVGTVMRQSAMLRYLRALRMGYDAGVGFPKTAEMAARSVRNPVIERRLLAVAAATAQGDPLTPALEQLRLLQSHEVALLRVGERTGSLSEALGKVEALYAQDVARGRTRLVGLITGGLYATVFLLVAGHVIGFYSAYFAQLR